MPQYPINQGVILTIGFYGGGERFQCVIPFLYTTAYDPNTVGADFTDYFENVLAALWQGVLAADMQIVGFQVEPMGGPGFVPTRKVYPVGTYVGSVAGDSYSQNVSMLIAWRSSDQAASGARVRTGKCFLGPPPESKCANRTVLAAFIAGDLTSLAIALLGPQVGVPSGLTIVKALSADAALVGGPYQANVYDIRSTVFTQKRRLTPII